MPADREEVERLAIKGVSNRLRVGRLRLSATLKVRDGGAAQSGPFGKITLRQTRVEARPDEPKVAPAVGVLSGQCLTSHVRDSSVLVMTLSSTDYPLAWTQPDRVRTFLADMAPQNVGKRVAELRKARRISQEALADTLGVRARTISRWETGATGGLYDDDIITRLAKALGVQPEDIIGPRQPVAVEPTEMADLRGQLQRIEAKLDLVLAYVGLEEEERELNEAVDAVVRALEDHAATGEAAAATG